VPAEGLGKAGIQLRAAWQDVDAHAVGRFQRRRPASAAVVHDVCRGGRRQVTRRVMPLCGELYGPRLAASWARTAAAEMATSAALPDSHMDGHELDARFVCEHARADLDIRIFSRDCQVPCRKNLEGRNDAATADAGLRACKAARLLCVLLHSMCMCVVRDISLRGKGSYHYI